MFETVVKLLLAGEFICPVSQHDSFLYLNDELHRSEVNDYLAKIGLRVAKTRYGGAWFSAHLHTADDERKAARELFVDIKHTLRPIVSFLDMMMRVVESEQFLSLGTTLEVNRLMAAIDANPSFRNDLQTLAMQLKVPADGTDRNRLDKVLKSFRDRGYLKLVNNEREIYQLTGKIEFIQEVIEFLMEYDAIQVDTPELRDVQGSLL